MDRQRSERSSLRSWIGSSSNQRPGGSRDGTGSQESGISNASSRTNVSSISGSSSLSRSVLWGGQRHKRGSVTAIVTNALDDEEHRLDQQLQNFVGDESDSQKRRSRPGMRGNDENYLVMSDGNLEGIDGLEAELARAEEAYRMLGDYKELEEELVNILEAPGAEVSPVPNLSDTMQLSSVQEPSHLETLPEVSESFSDQPNRSLSFSSTPSSSFQAQTPTQKQGPATQRNVSSVLGGRNETQYKTHEGLSQEFAAETRQNRPAQTSFSSPSETERRAMNAPFSRYGNTDGNVSKDISPQSVTDYTRAPLMSNKSTVLNDPIFCEPPPINRTVGTIDGDEFVDDDIKPLMTLISPKGTDTQTDRSTSIGSGRPSNSDDNGCWPLSLRVLVIASGVMGCSVIGWVVAGANTELRAGFGLGVSFGLMTSASAVCFIGRGGIFS